MDHRQPQPFPSGTGGTAAAASASEKDEDDSTKNPATASASAASAAANNQGSMYSYGTASAAALPPGLPSQQQPNNQTQKQQPVLFLGRPSKQSSSLVDDDDTRDADDVFGPTSSQLSMLPPSPIMNGSGSNCNTSSSRGSSSNNSIHKPIVFGRPSRSSLDDDHNNFHSSSSGKAASTFSSFQQQHPHGMMNTTTNTDASSSRGNNNNNEHHNNNRYGKNNNNNNVSNRKLPPGVTPGTAKSTRTNNSSNGSSRRHRTSSSSLLEEKEDQVDNNNNEYNSKMIPRASSTSPHPTDKNKNKTSMMMALGRPSRSNLEDDDDDKDDDDAYNNFNPHAITPTTTKRKKPRQPASLPVFLGKPAARGGKGLVDDDSTVGGGIPLAATSTTTTTTTIGTATGSGGSSSSNSADDNDKSHSDESVKKPAPVIFGKPSRKALDDEESTVATPMNFPSNNVRGNNNNDDSMAARKPPPHNTAAATATNNSTSCISSSNHANVSRKESYGDDTQPMQPSHHHRRSSSSINNNNVMSASAVLSERAAAAAGNLDDSSTASVDDFLNTTTTTTRPGAVAKQSSHPLNPDNMSEADMLEAAIKASQEEQEALMNAVSNNSNNSNSASGSSSPSGAGGTAATAASATRSAAATTTDATTAIDEAKIETIKYNARTVREICACCDASRQEHNNDNGSNTIDLEVLQFAIQECQSDLKDLAELLGRQDDGSQVEMLLDLNGIVLNAIETGNETAQGFSKKMAPVASLAADSSQSAASTSNHVASAAAPSTAANGSSSSSAAGAGAATTNDAPSNHARAAASATTAESSSNSNSRTSSRHNDNAATTNAVSNSLGSSDLNVDELVKIGDVFSLICMLRSQDEPRMQAALALMRFARAAANIHPQQQQPRQHSNTSITSGGSSDDDGDHVLDATRVRAEVRSLGGMHSLLALFRTRGTLYELKVVAAIAVAYIVPSFDVSDNVKPSLCLEILECLSFLSTARTVTPHGETIDQDESFAAAGMALTTFWVDVLENLLHKQEEAPVLAPNNNTVSLIRRVSTSGTGMMRSSSSSYTGGAGGGFAGMGSNGVGKGRAMFDQRREAIELQELLDMTVSLIIKVAQKTKKGVRGGDPVLLVEQMCAVEIARPIAVREGILSVLVGWIRSREKEKIRPASAALRSLTSIKDKYMAGWIHSQMVNEGALPGIAILTQDISLTQDVRLAIAQILSSLCVAPHTRAAVLEADCVHFLIDILYDHTDSSSQEVALFAGSALLQLAAGAITRASVFHGDDTGFTGFVTTDKRDMLVDDIVQRGAVASFVSIALHRRGKLRRVAIEALRVLSEDISPSRFTRLQLCEDGAAEALGRALTDDLEKVFGALEGKVAFIADMETNVKELHEALCTLANMLQPIYVHFPTDERRIKDTKKLLIEGCIQTVQSGGLDALIKVISLPQEPSLSIASEPTRTLLICEACRSLASISPLLLDERVASSGYTSWASNVLTSIRRLLDQILDDQKDDEDASDIHVSILQAVEALAKSAPLRVRIIDTILPHLIQHKSVRERTEISKAAALAFESLNFSQDEEAAQVAGNNASLLADWFCLKRSLLLQMMSRMEIIHTIRSLWNLPAKTTELQRHASGESNYTGCSSTGTELFDGLAMDEDSLAFRETILKQYSDVYHGADGDRHLVKESGRNAAESMLARQVFPMNNSYSEASWILDHQDVMNGDYDATMLTPHVTRLLETCLPCQLLRDYIVPTSTLRPTASFDFRALMMPQRRYFSFSREGKLLKSLCTVEAASIASSNVHWTLGFTNSSFAGEFSESLVRALYLSPMIRGLSFSRNADWKRIQLLETESKVEDAGSLLANLTAALPAWISCLSFKGVIKNQDLLALIATLEEKGKLSLEQEGRENADDWELIAKEERTLGQFWFFAISHCTDISAEAWSSFFQLIGTATPVPKKISTSPIASLRALDLSYNELGDRLCGMILERIHDQKTGCAIERLDLSGNFIGEGTNVLKAFFDYVQQFRRDQRAGHSTFNSEWKSPLHTIRLADNNLHVAKAWLEIIALLKNNALDLQLLDLSENELSFDENSYDCEVLVSSLLKNTSLSNLNLAKNNFSAESIDEIFSQLGKIGNESGLAFLDLSNNTPVLTSSQSAALETIREKARAVAMHRYNLARETKDEDDTDYDFSNRRPSVIVPPIRAGSSTDVNVTAAEYPDMIRGHRQPETSLNNMITVLFSAPLVFLDTSRVIRPFEKLDFNMERELLWQCLKEASRDIQLSFDSASSKRLLATMTKQCSCLHYSGHGHPNYLAFEDEAGGPHWFHSQQIKDLIASREGSAPFQFVFVSACYSGLAGETFASAGVPHVVCCQQESELKDAAALAFTRQFYLALAVGHTVKYSFDQACKAVRATPNLREADQEMQKFVLLPRDGNHEVPIFDANPVNEWPKPPKERSTKAKRGQRHQKSNRGVGAGTIELSVRNMIQEDPSPSPPQFFLGREVDMYHVLTKVLSKRLVSVGGEDGIGRSSLVCALSHYICERASTMPLIEHIYYVKAKHGTKANAVKNLVLQLLEKIVESGKLDTFDNETDMEAMFDLVCSALKLEKALVVFDHLELLEGCDEANEFPVLLSNMFRKTRNVRVLLTTRNALGIPSLGGQVEHHHVLGALNFASTVRLYSRLSPFLYTPADQRQFVETLVPNEREEECTPNDAKLPDPVKRIFAAMGDGIPSRIEKAAYSASDTFFLYLKTGKVRAVES